MNFRKRLREQPEVETGALADILFFLLMFFLMISTLASPDAIKVLLPESSTASSPPKDVVKLSIDENKNFFIEGKPVTPENLEASLAAEKELKKAETLVVRIDKNRTVQDLTDLYDIGTRLKLGIVLTADKKK
ncbi:MAG: biopolymer transporter ExbD [Pseudarcicella sp.]|nr:biopolymer transporter ExbD [Pseudarcicella sp.]MBP6409851.1 biopolymer transporter ExbD [Pseudarcicella sp.]